MTPVEVNNDGANTEAPAAGDQWKTERHQPTKWTLQRLAERMEQLESLFQKTSDAQGKAASSE